MTTDNSTAPVPGLTPMRMRICEAHRLVLRLGQPYVFTEDPTCDSCRKAADEAREAYGPDGGAAIAAAPHTATQVVHPTGARVIGMLRQAMINAEVPFELRAAVIGHFCNEWNADAAAPASDADSMQGSQPKESRDDTR